MGAQPVRIKDSEDSEESEKTILEVLNRHHGRMSITELFRATRTAGISDEVLIRSALWHLISQARIKRDADTISVGNH